MLSIAPLIRSINTLLSPLENIIIRYISVIKIGLLIVSFLVIFLIFVPDLQKETGEQAMSVLLFILFLPVLSRVCGLSLAQTLMPLRKEAGILMGVLAWVHSVVYFFEYPDALTASYFWWQEGFVSYLAVGLVALIITTPLLVTSNDYAIKLLGKKWKMLHRTVYGVALFTLLHVILIQWARRNSIDYGTLALLIGYFIGKILEWKGISFAPKKTYPKGQKFLCVPCGYIYDPAVGDIEDGIAPGTEFMDIPENWRCPICGVTKADFVPYDEQMPMASYPATVIKKTLLNKNTLELIVETEALFASRPGQFMTFLFTDAHGDFARSYSIAGVKNKQCTFVIKLLPNGRGTAQLNALQSGTPVTIRGIFGQFILAHTLAPKIFIATGTGLAPIIHMIRALPDTVKKALYFSVSTEKDLFYVQELRAIKHLDLHIYLSREEVEGYISGRINVDTIEASQETEWYLCGNPAMIQETKDKLMHRGYTQIHTEAFR